MLLIAKSIRRIIIMEGIINHNTKGSLDCWTWQKLRYIEWELLGVFGNPQRIDDPSVYKVNADKRLLNDPKARVSFAIHLTKIS